MNTAVSVFVDTCAFQHAYPFKPKPTEVIHKMNWGGQEVALPPMEVEVAKDFGGDDFLQREVPLLTRIAALAEARKINWFTSELIFFELFERPGTAIPWSKAHPFFRCPPTKLPSCFDCTLWFGQGEARPTEQLLSSFENYPDPQLQSLVSTLGRTRLVDSVHLLTADRHKMDFFLTTDKKLVEAYRRSPDPLEVWPVFPSELLRNLHEAA